MKTLIFSILFLSSFSFSSRAGQNAAPFTLKIMEDTVKQPALAPLLSFYYGIKNALVNSDAKAASAQADAFVKAIAGTDMKTLPEAEHKAFMSLQSKLSFDARHIAEVQDISHQREHFANLSLNMYALAKAAKLSTQPVYQDYCPMKKAYWLSSESSIKNPYFGSQMLTCGKVTATL